MTARANKTAVSRTAEAPVRGDAISAAAPVSVGPISHWQQYQQAFGNQALQRSLLAAGSATPRVQRTCAACSKQSDDKAGLIQTKLTVNEPGDAFEREADRVADAVMRMPEASPVQTVGRAGISSLPSVQRVCQECEQELQRAPESLQRASTDRGPNPNIDPELEGNVQAKEAPGHTPTASATTLQQIAALRGSGQSLPQSERSFFESRLGYDFSAVQMHTDDRAADSARQVQALAYTTGRDVVFGAGQYRPETSSGRRLIAHELAHVVQQGGARQSAQFMTSQTLSVQSGGLSAANSPTSIQRMGDPAQAPKTMTCPIASTSSIDPVLTSVLFDNASAVLTPKAIAELGAVAAEWNAVPLRNARVRIDGYASTDGPQPQNWTLSCNRANTVATELETPSSGAPGIPGGFLDIFAQGATSEFAADQKLNRRATISASLPTPAIPAAGCASPGDARSLDLQPVFLRTGPADPSPTGTSWSSRFNKANAIWGKLGITFNDLGAVTLDTPLKTTGNTIPERDAVAALRAGPGVEVFLVDNDMATAGGASTRPPGTPLCDGNIVMSDRGTSDTILAHELGHELGIVHPGDPGNPGDANTVMEPSGSHSAPNPTRNTIGNSAKILCPPGTATTCLHPDP